MIDVSQSLLIVKHILGTWQNVDVHLQASLRKILGAEPHFYAVQEGVRGSGWHLPHCFSSLWEQIVQCNKLWRK